MEKNTRIIIGAVLILFIAMVSFKFDTLTGAAAQEFESTAVFDVSPKEMDKPGEPIYGTVKTEIETIEPQFGNKLTYGKTYIDAEQKVCVLELASKVRKFCATLSCMKEDSNGGCIEADFNLRTGLGILDYGKSYTLKVWEYKSIGNRKSGKFIYGGNFIIKEEPIKYR